MARLVNGIANVLASFEITPDDTEMYDMSNVISFIGGTGTIPLSRQTNDRAGSSIAVCKRSSLVTNDKYYHNELMTFLHILTSKKFCIIVLDYNECTANSTGDCVYTSNNAETDHIVNSVRPCALRRTVAGASYIDYDTISHSLCSVDDIVMMALSQLGYNDIVTSDVELYDDITSQNVYISSEFFDSVPLAGAYIIMGYPEFSACKTIHIDATGMPVEEVVAPLMDIVQMFSQGESKKIRLPLSKHMPTVAKKKIRDEYNQKLNKRRPRYSRR